jgi:hypothetical protein
MLEARRHLVTELDPGWYFIDGTCLTLAVYNLPCFNVHGSMIHESDDMPLNNKLSMKPHSNSNLSMSAM